MERDRTAEYMKRRDHVREDYIEDSTRGGSLYNPITFKRDVPVQVWLESRKLWALSQWLDSKGYNTKFMSEIVKEAIDIIIDNLDHNSEIKLSNDIYECREMLSIRYRISLPIGNEKTWNEKGKKGGKNIIHNQLLTERLRERQSMYTGRYNETEEERTQRLKEMANSFRPTTLFKERTEEEIEKERLEIEEINRKRDERIAINKKRIEEGIDIEPVKPVEQVDDVEPVIKVSSRNAGDMRRFTDDEWEEKERLRKERDKLIYDDAAWELPKTNPDN